MTTRGIGPIALAIATLTGVGGSQSALAEQPTPDLCTLAADARSALDVGFTCVQGANGIVLGPASDAQALLPAIQTAATQFSAHFDPVPNPMAVVFGGKISPAVQSALSAKGFVVLPWLNGGDKRRLIEQSIREQVLKQTAALPEDQRQAIIAQALAKVPQTRGGAMDDKELGAVSHEISHIWFARVYDRRAKVDSSAVAGTEDAVRRYGGSAADWLDEMAAVLAENETLATSRRGGVTLAIGAKGENLFWPLAEYFTMDHPQKAAISRALASGAGGEISGGARALVLTGDDAAKVLSQSPMPRPDWFYVQARAFADFMFESSGDPMIFSEVYKALAGGNTMADWLKSSAAKHGLPTTVPALQAKWDAWVARKAQQAS